MKSQDTAQAHDNGQPQSQAPRVRPAAPAGAPSPAAAVAPRFPLPTPSFADEPAAHAPVRPNDRRRSPRQTLVAKAIVRSEVRPDAVATGFLSNISTIGVGFHTRRPLPVGDKFQMRLELGPVKWATRLRVVSCQPHDSGTFDIGAEFIPSAHDDSARRASAD
jgi:hypothetical protein